MENGGIDAGVEIAVGYGLQLLETPVILSPFRPAVGEALCPHTILATAAGGTEGGIHLLLAEFPVTHPELCSHLVGSTAVSDAVGREGTVGVRLAPCAQPVLMSFLGQSAHIL